jgi:hypothetical protein
MPEDARSSRENAPPTTDFQPWTAARKKLYEAPLNPADQMFAAAEFVKTDRLHSGSVIESSILND